MTPPIGYVCALYAGSGVVKVPDILTTSGDVIPGSVLGPGDIHTVSEGEAWESSNWTPCNEDGTPLPESASPLPKVEDAATPDPDPPTRPVVVDLTRQKKDGDD